MRVLKRDGVIVPFDPSKIATCVNLALRETGVDDYNLAIQISLEATELLKLDFSDSISKDTPLGIEDIQKITIKALSKHNFDAGIRYTIYREYRSNNRIVTGNYQYLDSDFISNYKHIPSPMAQLGNFVYYRTYSRWVKEENRREFWWETVRRAVEYNVGLDKTLTFQEAKAEAQELFDNIFHLRQFLSGRTFWVGGTVVGYKYPMANYNCALRGIDSVKSFRDIFYVLMIGAGVGVGVRDKFVKLLPAYRTDYELINEDYSPVPKYSRQDNTSVDFKNEIAFITVGDSKEGWADSLEWYMNIITSSSYKNIKTIIINYDNVRPKGEKLKIFGGTASGHTSLLKMFKSIDKVLKAASAKNMKVKFKLTPLEALDIANIIGENVVSGGVRRTSEIGLADSGNNDIKSAKSNLYVYDEPTGKFTINKDLAHRQMSNNTIIYSSKPSLSQWDEHFQLMRRSGEPGFLNEEAALLRAPYFQGVNPCGEILLDNKGLCNLQTINYMAFVETSQNETDDYLIGKDGYVLNLTRLLRAFELASRASLRMTLMELELPEWDEIQKEHRLLGVSFTGWQDMLNCLGFDWIQKTALLMQAREAVHKAANSYSDKIGINRPKLMTTVKPEGTLSQLPTVSSGLHFSHSPYYIRRVRISSNDPLVKVCEELEWPVYPEVGQDKETCVTKYVEFPVKAPEGKTKYQATALEQLKEYKMIMEAYVDHNASVTIHIREHEWDEVRDWIYENWDSCVALSFLSLDDSFYEALPYEAIDKEEYDKRVSEMKLFSPSLISKYEKEEQELDAGTDGCDAGACPIR